MMSVLQISIAPALAIPIDMVTGVMGLVSRLILFTQPVAFKQDAYNKIKESFLFLNGKPGYAAFHSERAKTVVHFEFLFQRNRGTSGRSNQIEQYPNESKGIEGEKKIRK